MASKRTAISKQPGKLSQAEINDILASRKERKQGKAKRFDNAEELIEWLDSDSD
jgi:hypothetical protein